MRITNSDVSLASQYQRVTVDQSSTSVRTWRERPAPSLPEHARGNAYGHERQQERSCGCDEPEETSGDYRLAMMRMLVEVRSSGVFLREQGGAGVVQQIDLLA